MILLYKLNYYGIILGEPDGAATAPKATWNRMGLAVLNLLLDGQGASIAKADALLVPCENKRTKGNQVCSSNKISNWTKQVTIKNICSSPHL